VNDLSLFLSNKIVISTFSAYLVTSLLKVLIEMITRGQFDFSLFFKSGHMPSSHTATVVALATSVYHIERISTLFIVTLVFALIVIYDAVGVRRAAGKQAEVINKIVEDIHLFRKFKTKRLYEFLGHTPKQVLIGALIGIIVPTAVFLL